MTAGRPATRSPTLGQQMAATNGYTPEQASDLYITDGTIDDWLWGVAQDLRATPSRCTRLSSGGGGFYPPDEVIARETTRNREAVLQLLERRRLPVRGDRPDLRRHPAAGRADLHQQHRRRHPRHQRRGELPDHRLRAVRQRPAATPVAVDIRHTYRGDLVVDLIAPDGSSYRLKNSSSSDSADNVITTYTANPSTEAKNGTWRLQVRDVYRTDTGYINSWSITL